MSSQANKARVDRNGLEAPDLTALSQALNDIGNTLLNLKSQPAPAQVKKGLLGGKNRPKSSAKDYHAELSKAIKALMTNLDEWRLRPRPDERAKLAELTYDLGDDNTRVTAGSLFGKLYSLVANRQELTPEHIAQLQRVVGALKDCLIPKVKDLNPPQWQPTNPMSAEPVKPFDDDIFGPPPSFEEVAEMAQKGLLPTDKTLHKDDEDEYEYEDDLLEVFNLPASADAAKGRPETAEERLERYATTYGDAWTERDEARKMIRTGVLDSDDDLASDEDADPIADGDLDYIPPGAVRKTFSQVMKEFPSEDEADEDVVMEEAEEGEEDEEDEEGEDDEEDGDREEGMDGIEGPEGAVQDEGMDRIEGAEDAGQDEVKDVREGAEDTCQDEVKVDVKSEEGADHDASSDGLEQEKTENDDPNQEEVSENKGHKRKREDGDEQEDSFWSAWCPS